MTKPLHIKKPEWLKTKIPTGANYFAIKRDLRAKNLTTVCEEAKCPNIGECWNTKTATFMLLGDTCTRACRFCHVKTGNPNGFVDPSEPNNVARSCKVMGLRYVVMTMVDRDDLADGGALQITKVVRRVKEENPNIIVELLGGDFGGLNESLATIVTSGIEVFAHNLETVERLSKRVRDARADYGKSLTVLQKAKTMAIQPLKTKSSLMLGLGETTDEVVAAMRDLRRADVDILTLGQYMRPTKKHLAVKEWVPPKKFEDLRQVGLSLGFAAVASGPLVRSSYKAVEFFGSTLT